VRRARHSTTDEAGQDAFLDIVANLVGILIILIMIVGAQAKDAMLRAEVPTDEVRGDEVEAEKNAAVAVRYDLQRLKERMRKQDLEVAYRRAERDRMLALMRSTNASLEEQRQQLSQDEQVAHRLQLQIAAAQKRQEDLKMSREVVQRNTAPIRLVRHRPTPLAKTVFGREAHFRLKGGRLVFVPLNELIEQFKTEAKQKAWKLRQAPAITETVGPIRDFRLKYTLKKETYSLPTRAGTAYQERVQLDRFVLIPVRDDVGEPFDAALQPQSQFRSILSTFNPNEATVTVWVYPDSFDQFRLLKEELYQLGFLTAGRPMPDGQPISGSPDGTRSVAQ
jgi:hypothetical protein